MRDSLLAESDSTFFFPLYLSALPAAAVDLFSWELVVPAGPHGAVVLILIKTIPQGSVKKKIK